MKELLKGVIGAVAPTIGTALGGPMGPIGPVWGPRWGHKTQSYPPFRWIIMEAYSVMLNIVFFFGI